MGLGVFDLHGGPFLMLYATLMVVALGAALLIPRWLRPEGRMRQTGDVDRIAYLAGGPSRFGEALLARLMSRGLVTVDKRMGFVLRGKPSDAATVAEAAVLGLSSPANWAQVGRTIRMDADSLRGKLASDGLLIDEATAWQMRAWQTLPLLLLIGFGLTKWEIGRLRDKPVGYLTALLVLTGVLALLRFVIVDRRTRAGLDVLEDARLQAQRLKRAPTSEEAALAVALFGTSVLAGSMLGDLHAYRRSGGDSSGSDSSSGCSGGGCGGGGCGGCGG